MARTTTAAAGYATVELVANRVLGPGTFVMSLAGCEFLADAQPGQFVMLRAAAWGNDPLLPRAFSLLDVESGSAEILVKTCGKATALLERAHPGEKLSVLGPLGSSFPPPVSGRTDWLIAGGVGLAPLLMHARRAAREGAAERVTMFYGGRTGADLVLRDQIAACCGRVEWATEDGSEGFCGYVTDAVARALGEPHADAPTLLACGPEPMLEAVAALAHRTGVEAFLSLEGEMACGIGVCLACAVPCRSKPYRYTCVDGPVFALGDLAGRYRPGGPG